MKHYTKETREVEVENVDHVTCDRCGKVCHKQIEWSDDTSDLYHTLTHIDFFANECHGDTEDVCDLCWDCWMWFREKLKFINGESEMTMKESVSKCEECKNWDIVFDIGTSPCVSCQHADGSSDCFIKKEQKTEWTSFNEIQKIVNDIAHEKGWWDNPRSDGEVIALCHSELSECLEGMRHGNPISDKITKFSAIEEELADTIIRIMDYAEEKKHRVAEAILAKIEYNRNREYKHGGKSF